MIFTITKSIFYEWKAGNLGISSETTWGSRVRRPGRSQSSTWKVQSPPLRTLRPGQITLITRQCLTVKASWYCASLGPTPGPPLVPGP